MRERKGKSENKESLNFFLRVSASTLFTRNFARGLKPPLEKSGVGKSINVPPGFLTFRYTWHVHSTWCKYTFKWWCVSVHGKERGVREVSAEKVPCGNAKRPEIRYAEWWFGCFFHFRFLRKKNERAPSNNFSKRCLLLVSFHLLDVTDILNCIYRPMYHSFDGMVLYENPFVK